MITPIENILQSNIIPGIDLRIKRDDLFPETGGGNKARKILYIVQYAKYNGFNALVTNGGIQSNHARATALASAKFGFHCHLVIHSKNIEKTHLLLGNLLLMYQLGSEIEFCRLESLAEAMENSMERARSEGYKPLYIWGGGHCLQGSIAYYDAAQEAQKQCGEWIPDYIIHASGTGTTQAGLIAGYAHLKTKVIGISVAREKNRGIEAIEDSLLELCNHLNLDVSPMTIDFRDNWTFGGYEKISPDLTDCIDNAAQNSIILDPTYTGKAYYAMKEMVNSGEIPHGNKILFWHTGGLLNLMSSPYYVSKTI